MKKIFLLIAIIAFAGTTKILAQGQCLTGSCPVSLDQWPTATQSTTSPSFVPISGMWPGEFALCNVTAGVTYEWSTCTTDGATQTTPYDSELILFNGSTNAVICYSDDYCGINAKIQWTATFTGTVKIQVNEYNCLSQTFNDTDIMWRAISNTSNDAAVSNVYTLGTLPSAFSNPHNVKARISNLGSAALNNVPVTLTVSGANSFTTTVTIPSLAVGASTVITFAGYNPSNLGLNTVSVSVPNDGNNNNNLMTVSQTVSTNTFSQTYGTSSDGGVGFTGSTGEVAVKYRTTSPVSIGNITAFINNPNFPFKVAIYDVAANGGPGNKIYSSASQTSVVGQNSVAISPSVQVTGAFFVGLEQTGIDNIGLDYQSENILRDSTIYAKGGAATSWFDLSPANIFKVKIDAVTAACALPAQPGSITGNTTICGGSSHTYTVSPVSGANSYFWSLPSGWTGTSTTNSITITAGNSSGTISVGAVNSCGAGTPSSLNVAVNPLPNQPASISGANTLCDGQSQTYTISPVSGASSYVWTIPAGWTGSSTTTSITITSGSNSGSISVSGVNNCGQGAAQSLAINIAPALVQPLSISGNNEVCNQSVQNYSVPSVVGATSYIWTLPSGWSGSSNTNTISVGVGTSGGTIMVTASNACSNSPAQMMAITVTQTPQQPTEIIGSAALCEGQQEVYSVNPAGGNVVYNWVLPAGWMGNSTSNVITVTASPNGGFITVTAMNNCGVSSAQTKSVTSAPSPGKPIISFSGTTLTSSSSTGNQWYLNGSPIGGATGQTYTPVTNGSYTVLFTESGGCKSMSDPIELTNLSITLHSNMQEIAVFPNPSNGIINIAVKGFNLVDENVLILNMLGKTVKTIPSDKFRNQKSEYIFDGRDLGAGIYFLKVTSEGKSITKKFVIQ
jgi:hypothetical protein